MIPLLQLLAATGCVVGLPPWESLQSDDPNYPPFRILIERLRVITEIPCLVPNDVFIHSKDMTKLRGLTAKWIRQFYELRGEDLRRAVNFEDLNYGPRTISKRSIDSGFAYVKLNAALRCYESEEKP